jgi:hypothetical protein
LDGSVEREEEKDETAEDIADSALQVYSSEKVCTWTSIVTKACSI